MHPVQPASSQPLCSLSFNCEIPNPITLVCDKVRGAAEYFFGFIVRIIVFQLSEMHKTGAYYIIRLWQKLNSDPREAEPVNQERLEKSKALLIQYGGKEYTVEPADGGAKIKCMIFKSADFMNELERGDAQMIPTQFEGRARRVIVGVNEKDAKKFSFPLTFVKRNGGKVDQAALLPLGREGHHPTNPMILHSHSPGRSMCMDRKFIAQHLAAGYDVTVWDPRGTTIESTGVASEGGYYLDIEAVYQKVLAEGYTPDRIYASGYCKGAALAAHLKKKYHRDGINFIASNPFTSMKEVIETFGWLGKLAAHYGLKAIQSPELEERVHQDGFDNLEKFKTLNGTHGRSVIIHTIPDDLMPRGSSQKLLKELNRTSFSADEITRSTEDGKCGHIRPPLEDPDVWARYVRLVT